MEEVTSGMVQITGELELRIEHEDTTAMYHVKLKQMSNCFFMNEHRKWFLEMESTPDKDDLKTVEKTTKDLKYNIKHSWKNWGD